MKVLLVCYAGMSTSLLVTKLQKATAEKELKHSFSAIGAAEIMDYLEDNEVEFILVGPQARHSLKNIEKATDGLNIPIKVIESKDYGMMNTEAILSMISA